MKKGNKPTTKSIDNPTGNLEIHDSVESNINIFSQLFGRVKENQVFIVFSIPLIGYAAFFIYQSSYVSFYNIPYGLIEFELSAMVFFYIVLVLILFTIFVYFSSYYDLVDAILGDKSSNYQKFFSKYLFFIPGYISLPLVWIFIKKIQSNLDNKFLALGLFYSAFLILVILDSRISRPTIYKIRSFFHITSRILLYLSVILVIIASISHIGTENAKTQNNFYVINANFPCAILLQTKERVLCKSYDLQNKLLFNELFSYKIDDFQNYPISILPIGPLTPVYVKPMSFESYKDRSH